MKQLLALAVVVTLGCGSTPEPAPAPVDPPVVSAAPPPSPEVAPAAVEEAPAPAPIVEVAPAVALDEVDLLRAVPARVAVSSAYHDDATQVAHIADGDLTTAWNSRTGDLVGAWIELEVPADASVRAIAMTVGFTRTTDRSDLFLGNHRVSRVRVSRGAEVLGEHDLDTSSRALVEIPVGGAGGVLRVEVLATVPGTHADWRELCVSEIRVLGSAPGASAGTLTPTTSVGGAGADVTEGEDAEDADDAEDAEDAALEQELVAEDALQTCASLMSEWGTYASDVSEYLENPPLANDATRATLARAQARHRALFEHAATVFAEVSPEAAADATARVGHTYGFSGYRSADLEALISGCTALMARYPSQACGWSEERAFTRVQEIVNDSMMAVLELESNVELREDFDGNPVRGEALQAMRAELAVATAFDHWLDGIHAIDWDHLGRRQRAALLGGTLPPPMRARTAWEAARADVQSADTACAGGH
jgi:hypothetical protein